LPLKQYVPNGSLLYWGVCGPSGDDPFKYSVNKMINILKSNSLNGNILVDYNIEIEPWNREETIFMIDVDTEGWTGEYPYLSFGFRYSTETNKWDWRGICYSSEPPIKLTKDGKYERKYSRQPALPRVGPKTFKNYWTLQARIQEIVRFREFDTLAAYAIKNVLIFGQCNREMMDKDQIVGKTAPVKDVISFLKNNVPAKGKISTPNIHHTTYYETEGWSDQYPFVAFWFSKMSKEWELAGVSYCKTSHIDSLKTSP
jgi:hypothetical protein